MVKCGENFKKMIFRFFISLNFYKQIYCENKHEQYLFNQNIARY